MSFAWETSETDVANVFNRHKIDKSIQDCMDIIDTLDTDKVEKAALHGDSMDDQAEYAQDEIENQLISMKILPSDTVKKFPLIGREG